jgi:hypothetical protein
MPAGLALFVVAWVAWQQPQISSAQLETRTLAQPLEAEIQAIAGRGGPLWIGYAVPAPPGEHRMCCFAEGCVGCTLEAGVTRGRVSPPVYLEGAREVFVLFRVEQGKIGRIRTFTADCPLDAGGLPFVWLTGVRPADSVSLLAGLVRDETARLQGSALAALAFHGEGGVIEELVRIARESKNSSLRRQAFWWLGHTKDRRGFDFIERVLFGQAPFNQ